MQQLCDNIPRVISMMVSVQLYNERFIYVFNRVISTFLESFANASHYNLHFASQIDNV